MEMSAFTLTRGLTAMGFVIRVEEIMVDIKEVVEEVWIEAIGGGWRLFCGWSIK